MIRNRADNTIARYARDLNDIMNHTGLSPDALVETAKRADEVGIGDLKAKVLEGRTDSMKYILGNDFNRLLRSNGVKDLPEERSKYVPIEEHEPYTKEEIRSLLQWVNFLKGKLYVYFAAESGLRIHSLLGIKYRHIKEDFEKGKVPIFIRFDPKERAKAKSTGYPFLGEGSYNLLKDCVEKGLVRKDPEAYIFESTAKNRKDKNKSQPLTYAAIHDFLELARQKAAIKESKQPNHAFRSFFSHSLIKADIPEPIRKRFMGHSLGSGDAYVSKDVEELREYYKQAWPFINIDNVIPAQVQSEILESKRREEVLEGKVASLEKQLDRVIAYLDSLKK